jgi:lambda family phage tail tape measure protein
MAQIGSLSVKLGLVTLEWDKATDKATQQAKDLQKAFSNLGSGFKELANMWSTLGGSVTAGAFAFGELLHSTLEFSNEVKDLAGAYDISISKTLQFRDALQTSGGKAENASKMLGTLFAKIDDAQKGNEAAIAQFERMGLSFQDIKNAKPEEQINQITKALGALGSGNKFEQIKLIKEIFGRGGVGVDFEEVGHKVNQATEAYDRHAEHIKKLGDVSDNLKTTFDNLKIAFAGLIAPFASEGTTSIAKFQAILVGITSYAVVTGLGKLVAASYELAKAWQAVSISVAMAGGPLTILSTLAAGIAGVVVLNRTPSLERNKKPSFQGADEGDRKQEEAERKQAAIDSENANTSRRELIAQQAKIKLLQQQVGFENQLGKLKIDGLTIDHTDIQIKELGVKRQQELAQIESQRAQNLNKENLSEAQIANINKEANAQKTLAYAKEKNAVELLVAQREKEIKIINQQIELQNKIYMFDKTKIQLESDKYYMTDLQYKIANEELETQRKIASIKQQMIENEQRLGRGATLDAENAKLKDQIAIEESLSASRKHSMDIDEYRRTSFSEGWSQAFRQYAYDAENYSRIGADAFASVTNNMNTALDNFVKTGKLNFSDFAKSVIQDLIAIQLKMQATALLKSAFGGINFGSLFGGGVPDTASVFGSSNGMGYASGGEPPVGQASLVGENGPELFVPKQAGTIIPNNTLQGMMGSGSNQPSITYNGPYIANMSAIDTQSATQFLAKNKSAVWAANQTAQRSLPQSR